MQRPPYDAHFLEGLLRDTCQKSPSRIKHYPSHLNIHSKSSYIFYDFQIFNRLSLFYQPNWVHRAALTAVSVHQMTNNVICYSAIFCLFSPSLYVQGSEFGLNRQTKTLVWPKEGENIAALSGLHYCAHHIVTTCLQTDENYVQNTTQQAITKHKR